MKATVETITRNLGAHDDVCIVDESGHIVCGTDVRHIPYHLLGVNPKNSHFDSERRSFIITLPGERDEYDHAFIDAAWDEDPDRLRHEIEVVRGDKYDVEDELADVRCDLIRARDDARFVEREHYKLLSNVNKVETLLLIAKRRIDNGIDVDVSALIGDIAVALDWLDLLDD